MPSRNSDLTVTMYGKNNLLLFGSKVHKNCQTRVVVESKKSDKHQMSFMDIPNSDHQINGEFSSNLSCLLSKFEP